ncbi:MAG: [FeFe] hydrogenase H-cluster radical SAM maturase HydE, partial [Clostridia bacterium]|nr:[FeFe] hydrogenase H-cluster radical SAM maturase HydE [Clostridia bacterium]
ELLHPGSMSFDNRMKCLETLKNLGFQTGCGFMVGSPYQTSAHIAADLKFIEEFRPQMCGIGPFIPHKDTPFADKTAGTAELTCYLLSIVRLMLPQVLLPATTALGSIRQGGREEGIKAGANVVMPNLSPNETKEKYMLYNNKLSSGSEAAANVAALAKQMEAVGYRIVTDRGDYKA